jgi:hypothetical protein
MEICNVPELIMGFSSRPMTAENSAVLRTMQVMMMVYQFKTDVASGFFFFSPFDFVISKI